MNNKEWSKLIDLACNYKLFISLRRNNLFIKATNESSIKISRKGKVSVYSKTKRLSVPIFNKLIPNELMELIKHIDTTHIYYLYKE